MNPTQVQYPYMITNDRHTDHINLIKSNNADKVTHLSASDGFSGFETNSVTVQGSAPNTYFDFSSTSSRITGMLDTVQNPNAFEKVTFHFSIRLYQSSINTHFDSSSNPLFVMRIVDSNTGVVKFSIRIPSASEIKFRTNSGYTRMNMPSGFDTAFVPVTLAIDNTIPGKPGYMVLAVNNQIHYQGFYTSHNDGTPTTSSFRFLLGGDGDGFFGRIKYFMVTSGFKSGVGSSFTCLSNCDLSPISQMCLCKEECSSGFQNNMIQQSNEICSTCSATAITFTGVGNCRQSCKFPDTTCQTVPNKSYYSITSSSFESCPTNCLQCNSQNQCDKCLSSKYWDPLTQQCVDTCPTGYYSDTFTSQCKMNTFQCKSYSSSTKICNACNIGYYLDFTTKLCLVDDCGDGQYKVSTGPSMAVCRNCVENCKTCQDGSTCSTCNTNFLLDPTSQCVSTCPTKTFEQKDNKCKSCLNNCNTCSDASSCSQCDTNFFLSLDQSSCITSCPTGQYSDSSQKKCQNCIDNCKECSTSSSCKACEDSFYYSSTTNTCTQTCPDNHFKNEATQTCDQCTSSTNHQSCTKCDDGCKVCHSNKTCITCEDNHFLNPDGQCKTECDANHYKIFSNSTCQKCDESCVICIDENNLKCPTEVFESAKEQAESASRASTASSSAAAISMASSASGASAFGLVIMNKFLLYIRYMRVQYSDELFLFLKNFDAPSLSFSMDVPKGVQSSLKNQGVPSNFAKYELQSSFLANYWSSGLTLIIVLSAIGVFTLLQILSKIYFKKLYPFIHQLTMVLRWNLFFLMLCGGYDEIILFTSLELRSLNIQNAWQVLSFLICLGMVGVTTYILANNVQLVYQYQKLKKQVQDKGIEDLKKFCDKWEYQQVLFKAYNNKSFMTQSYMFWFVLRSVIYNFIIAFLFDHPVAQAVLLVLLSITMFIYMQVYKPFKRKINLIEVSIYEICVFVTNFLVLILAAADDQGTEMIASRENIGKGIIVLFFIFSILATIFIVFYLLEAFWAVIKEIRQYKNKKGGISCLDLLTVPFQTSGMDINDNDLLALEKRNVKIVPVNVKTDIVKQHKKNGIPLRLKLQPDLSLSSSDIDISKLPLNTKSPNTSDLNASTVRKDGNSEEFLPSLRSELRLNVDTNSLSSMSQRQEND